MTAQQTAADIAEATGEACVLPDGSIGKACVLPDGSGFFVASMPLPKDHWIYSRGENTPPMPFRMESGPFKQAVVRLIREAAHYAIRASTMNGKEMDFDPDALTQNLIVGLVGYFTPDGRTRSGPVANKLYDLAVEAIAAREVGQAGVDPEDIPAAPPAPMPTDGIYRGLERPDHSADPGAPMDF